MFRYDYRMHGRRETLTLGRYGLAGLSLARAREKLIDAQRSKGGHPPRRSSARSAASRKQRASASLANAGCKSTGWPKARARCAARSTSGTSCRRSAIGY
nr:Arm DNA-binding domain-containing protein [Paracoccus aminovorans]